MQLTQIEIMFAEHLPGIEGPDDLKKIIESIENAKQAALFRGRIKSYDLFNETQKALNSIKFTN